MKRNSTDSWPEVLYEDNHIISINKRPSDIVQGDKTGDEPLSEILKDYLKEKYNKPGNVFLGVTHRLDRPVSGVVLFAKTGKALSRLNELFRNQAVRKSYWAVVQKVPDDPTGTLTHHLKKNEKQNKSYPVRAGEKGAKEAITDYKLIASGDNYYLLEVRPSTGRHHQIRAQLASIGCYIKGDIKYGAKRTNADASIHLHARSITFVHPVKKEKMTITADPPDESLWNAFVKMTQS